MIPVAQSTPVTTTQTLESPKTSDADTGDQLFHYVRKAKIAESAVMGTMVAGAVRRGLPGDPGGQAWLAGVPAVQGDLRVVAARRRFVRLTLDLVRLWSSAVGLSVDLV